MLAPLTRSRLTGWEQPIRNVASIQVRVHSSWALRQSGSPSAGGVPQPPHLPYPDISLGHNGCLFSAPTHSPCMQSIVGTRLRDISGPQLWEKQYSPLGYTAKLHMAWVPTLKCTRVGTHADLPMRTCVNEYA